MSTQALGTGILEGYEVFRQIRAAEGGWVMVIEHFARSVMRRLSEKHESTPFRECRRCLAIR